MREADSRLQPSTSLRFEEVQAGVEVALVFFSESRCLVKQLNLGPQVGDAVDRQRMSSIGRLMR